MEIKSYYCFPLGLYALHRKAGGWKKNKYTNYPVIPHR